MKLAYTFSSSGCWILLLTLLFTAGQLHAAEDHKKIVKAIFAEPALHTGLAILLDTVDGNLAESLFDGGFRSVHGVGSDRKKIEAARGHLFKRNKYGAIAFDYSQFDQLPYADSIANLIVVEDYSALAKQGIKIEEVDRILAPLGVLFIKGYDKSIAGSKKSKSGAWTTYIKARPDSMDEWSHFEHDATRNSVSKDKAIGPPAGLRWISQDIIYPLWSSANTDPFSFVSAGGRNFYWFQTNANTKTRKDPSKSRLSCRDAYNGLTLWEKPIDRSQHAHSLIATDDLVFIQEGSGGSLKALDAATGKEKVVFKGAKNVSRMKGELLYADGVLVQAASGVRGMDTKSGKTLWEKPNRLNGIDMLLIEDGKVYYLDRQGKSAPADLICCALQSGKEIWRKKQDLKHLQTKHSDALSLITIHQDMILIGSGSREEFVYAKPGPGTYGACYAINKKDGTLKWTYTYDIVGHKGRPTDVFPMGDSIWIKCRKDGHGFYYAEVDAKTGKQKNKYEGVLGRCYSDHAANGFIMTGGMDFMDTKTGAISYFGAARGTCDTGFISANALTYAFPIRCHCFNSVRGFLGLHSNKVELKWAKPVLEKGPAYGKTSSAKVSAKDWPMLRKNPNRASMTSDSVARKLTQKWSSDYASHLSSPVVANGILCVADIDQHRIIALDAVSGKEKWTHIAGGRIDAPPAMCMGMVIFGARDGRVTCLRASDGALAWRFLAAPNEEKIQVNGQMESTWPIPASILCKDGTAYFAAGRNSQTDGGLHCYALDIKSGKVKWRNTIAKQVKENNNDTLVLGNDSKSGKELLTINHRVFLDPSTGKINPKMRPRTIMTQWGMTTPSNTKIQGGNARYDVPRRMWSYGTIMPHFGPERIGRKLVRGHLLCIDGDQVYGSGEKLDDKYKVIFEKGQIHSKIFRQSENDKTWAFDIPYNMRQRSLIVTKDALLYAYTDEEGTNSGLWHLSKDDGKKLAEQKFDFAPRWDGMAIADGKLYIVSDSGSIMLYQ
ncbi:MAG: PQQ-binding-like beta-propeller repeat protein [Planctomycetes bacterium]|nr:PQQ-binding-like beta-propeller repeat protein [Planctomycetota bacterium]